MKQITNKRWLGWLWALLLLVAPSASALAQTVSGIVKDTTGETLIGVTVQNLDKQGVGALTNLDGEFTIKADKSDRLQFSYVGYKTIELNLATATFPLEVTLHEDVEMLEQVVVIGYGTAQKKDLTGSITTVTDANFKKGLISTPDQLISGKVAGVQIVSGGGAPGAGSKIRIRGGASLNASNDPLVVIDGVPLEGGTMPGAPSALSSINPNDIESMNVLKDASATAIYGSRASNGVIIITTKKGKLGQKLSVNASTRFSVATPTNFVDVLTGDQVREVAKASGNSSFINAVGKENTDWQREIYQNAIGTDNNISIAGSTSWLPYRVSVGYYNENGILRTDNMQRLSGDLSLNPRLLNGDLAIDLNLKGTQTRNRYADRGAIGAAVSMDPSHPVMSDDPQFAPFGGYWFLTGLSKDGELIPRNLAPLNPLAMLNDKEDKATVNRVIGNVKFDYQLPFLTGLRANLNLAYDYASSNGTIFIPTHSMLSYTNQEVGKGGLDKISKQEKINKLLDFYLNYRTEVTSIKSTFDLMAGYSYQDWLTKVYNYPEKTAGGIEYNKPVFDTDLPRNTLVSFYGRLNYALMGRYLFTATVRADGSSRFAKENRWGIFPSFAFAWRIKDESFLKDVEAVSDLKLRLGYGVTGQQDGIGNYSYLASYALSGNQSQMLLGDKWYHMYKPLAYDANIKWEQTATSNIGLDYAFVDNRISGSVDLYQKYTKDLLNEIDIPGGANFSNRLLTNIGEIENKGVEATLNVVPIETEDWYWNMSFNVTYNNTKIKKLTLTHDPNYLGVPTGGITGGTGNNIQIHSEGYAPSSFFVHKQVYDEAGKPIEGLYADLNGDGVITDADKYRLGDPEPKVYMGLSTSVSYKQLTLSAALRSSIGNYVYDNVSAHRGNEAAILNTLGWVESGAVDYYNTGFKRPRYLSDYYIKDASFLKMDNITLSYDFGKVFNEQVGIHLSGTVQNVFTITKYKGLDPEIGNGIDYQFYPVPRTYSLSLGLTF